MDRIKITKVENVQVLHRGIPTAGTLHLSLFHLVFSTKPSTAGKEGEGSDSTKKARPKESWIAYPIIWRCTFKPATTASGQRPIIRLQCRDFNFLQFQFVDNLVARDVFDSIRELTCKLGRIEKLYAFKHRPVGAEKEVNYWDIYDAKAEWRRQGISAKNVDKGWRVSNINSEYKFCPTYPSLLVVPTTLSDNVVNYAGRFRSRSRIPVLTYLHPVNNCSISRCAQPLTGMRNNRSIQDERLIEAIFSTSNPSGSIDKGLLQANTSDRTPSMRSSHGDLPSLSSSIESGSGGMNKSLSAEALEDSLVSELESSNDVEPIPKDSTTDLPTSFIQNEFPQNLIVDARPAVNAMAMQAIGLGSENMENYPFATRKYLGIDNIHVMRDSLAKVVDALKDSDIVPLPPNRELLARSQWLRYISILLDGADLIARTVGLGHSNVLIHCSDGWDRTSQLAALSQLSLDPYFRTLEGFIILIEKDWLSFGHQFRRRSGFLGNEKLFSIQNEGLSTAVPGSSNAATSITQPSAKAFESALMSAKGFFSPGSNSSSPASRKDKSSLNNNDSDSDLPTSTSRPNNPKETSPIFHQFLDAVYQLQHQHPTAFEFNERFLRRLLFHLNACQYGTFLYDNEQERLEAKASERTRCVWDYFLVRKNEWMNPKYIPPKLGNEDAADRLVFHNGKVRWWAECFGRTDEELNGPVPGSIPIVTQDIERTSAAQTPQNPAKSEPNGQGEGETETLPPTTTPASQTRPDMPSTGLSTASSRAGKGLAEGVQGLQLGSGSSASGGPFGSMEMK